MHERLAATIIEKGRAIASHVLEASPRISDLPDGRFTVAGTDRSIGIFEVAARLRTPDDLPEDLRGPLDAESDETVAEASFPYGCHVCEVEVDPDTGAVADRSLHRRGRRGARGQPDDRAWPGARRHRAGRRPGAAGSSAVYDRETGQLLTGSFMDYAMPRADLLPFFTTEISEVPSTTHPLGIRPAGEGGTTPALGVVVNAVVDALSEFGVTHVEMPVTPERVWRAIQSAQSAG